MALASRCGPPLDPSVFATSDELIGTRICGCIRAPACLAASSWARPRQPSRLSASDKLTFRVLPFGQHYFRTISAASEARTWRHRSGLQKTLGFPDGLHQKAGLPTADHAAVWGSLSFLAPGHGGNALHELGAVSIGQQWRRSRPGRVKPHRFAHAAAVCGCSFRCRLRGVSVDSARGLHSFRPSPI